MFATLTLAGRTSIPSRNLRRPICALCCSSMRFGPPLGRPLLNRPQQAGRSTKQWCWQRRRPTTDHSIRAHSYTAPLPTGFQTANCSVSMRFPVTSATASAQCYQMAAVKAQRRRCCKWAGARGGRTVGRLCDSFIGLNSLASAGPK